MAVQELSGTHHQMEAEQKGSLGTLAIRIARRHWSQPFMSDTTGKRLTFGKTLVGSLLLREQIRKQLTREEQEAVGILLLPALGEP